MRSHTKGVIMSDESHPPKPTRPPSPQELLASAKRLKSHALYVGATRLIQESRHLRENNERVEEEAERIRQLTSRKKPRGSAEK